MFSSVFACSTAAVMPDFDAGASVCAENALLLNDIKR
jgi:hypothetical protein